jgi:hypothetical protein
MGRSESLIVGGVYSPPEDKKTYAESLKAISTVRI